jgi:hypothetical protein
MILKSKTSCLSCRQCVILHSFHQPFAHAPSFVWCGIRASATAFPHGNLCRPRVAIARGIAITFLKPFSSLVTLVPTESDGTKAITRVRVASIHDKDNKTFKAMLVFENANADGQSRSGQNK